MLDERVANVAALAGKDLQRAGRQTGFMREFCEINRRERRLAGWLKNHGVAGCQRWSSFPAGDWEREVPWHNGGDGAHRLAQGEIESAATDRNRLAEELADRAGVIF